MTNEELVVRIKAGEKDLLADLWEQCYWFIYGRACRVLLAAKSINKNTGCEVYDLVNSGYFALVNAVERFEPDLNCAFITLLAMCLKTEFSEATGIRLARTQNDPVNSSISLDAPMVGSDGDTGDSFGSTIPDPINRLEQLEADLYREELKEIVHKKVDKLPQKEKSVICGTFFDGKTKKQCADEMGVSNSRVGQLFANALNILREDEELQELAEYRPPRPANINEPVDYMSGSAESVAIREMTQQEIRSRRHITTFAEINARCEARLHTCGGYKYRRNQHRID